MLVRCRDIGLANDSQGASMKSFMRNSTILTATILALFLTPVHAGGQTVEVPPDWLGYRLGFSPPELRAVDRVAYFVESSKPPRIELDRRYRSR